MNIRPRIDRLIGDAILLRRLSHTKQVISTAIGTHEIVHEELPSGLSVSSPGMEITRAEVVKAGPKCKLSPGQKVVLAKNVFGSEWREEGHDYILMNERHGSQSDILFAYRVAHL